MTLLLLALAALLAAPPLSLLARKGGVAVLQALDGFVLVAVGTLVLFALLPEAVAGAGPAALLLAAAGFTLPALAERGLHGHRAAHRLVLLLAVAGLTLHALLDGATLALGTEGGPFHTAALAVLLHRLPLGLLLWISAASLFGRGLAAAILLLLGGATITGYAAAAAVAGSLHGGATALFLALVAGGLLHVLLHQGGPADTRATPGRARAGATGGLLGLAAALPVLSTGVAGGADPLLGELLASWMSFAVPRLWLPVLLGGAVAWLAALPRRQRWLPEGAGILRGLWAGWSAPTCSCGAGPLYEDALLHGARPGPAMAFLQGATLLRPESVCLVLLALGPGLALPWLAAALVTTLVLILQAGHLAEPGSPPLVTGHASVHGPPESSLGRGRREAAEWLDQHAAWLAAAGLLTSALLLNHPGSALVTFLREHALVSTVLVALLALPCRVHLLVAVTLAVFLEQWKAPSGALLALLLVAPTGGRQLAATFRRLQGRGAWHRTRALQLGVGLGAGLALTAEQARIRLQPAVDHLVEDPTELPLLLGLAWGLLPALPVLLSWFRSGPRGWLAQVLPVEHHEHAHHPGLPHVHGGPEQILIDALPPKEIS